MNIKVNLIFTLRYFYFLVTLTILLSRIIRTNNGLVALFLTNCVNLCESIK